MRTGRVAFTVLSAWLAAVLLVPAPADGQAAVASVKAGNRAVAAGNPGAAVEAYRRALSLDPHSAVARFNLGTALAAAGQWDAAVEALSLAVEAFPDPARKASAYFNLGNTLARAGRLDDALAAYRASLRLRADDDARFNYSLVWRWRQAQGEGPAPEEPLAPQRVQEMRDKARALDVPVVRKPADRPPVDVDR
jgi:Ca-activated chloride channel family protein